MFRDKHHLIFDRVSWTSRPEAKKLRENPSLIVRLDRSEHSELHRHTVAVPLLGYHALVRTLRDYEPGATPLESVENLMATIEGVGNHPRAHPIEKSLTELAVWALDLERPFIADKQYE
jgi:hypothetical protein